MSRESFEYIGDSISVGFDEYGRALLVKEFSDGTEKAIAMDFEVLGNFYAWLVDSLPLSVAEWREDIKRAEDLLRR